jgi:D-glycero-alpha-D-manno-heptose 1-phosphate guanylyltransferase
MNAMRQAGLLQAVVVNGDTYFDGDISALHAPLRETELCRMGIVQIDDRSRYGGIDMGTEDSGIVRGFIEKGTSGPGWINAGHYRLNMQCFANVGTDQKFSFEEEILPTLVSRHNATYTKLQGKLIDIGIPSAYQYFCSLQEGTSTSN